MYKSSHFFLYCLVCFAFSYQTALATPPIPEKKTDSIEAVETQLRNKKSDQERLEKRVLTEKKTLQKTKKNLVKIAKKVKESEYRLQNLESDIQNNEREQNVIIERLKKDKQNVAQLLTALQRISRTPPELMLLRSDTPLNALQTAMIIRRLIPHLQNDAHELTKTLTALNTLTDTLNEQKRTAEEEHVTLKQKKRDLERLIQKRTQVYTETQTNLKQHKQDVQKIAQKAQDLKELIKRLKTHNESRTRNQNKKTKARHQAVPKQGTAQLPISGVVLSNYNQKDEFGAPQKGLRMKGRASGIVVAPMGGTIRFAGSFKNYGEMIIIEHKNGYHSLISGIDRIDTAAEQNVYAGEPIGTLHKHNPLLYYELRKNGTPVNPSTKFKGL